MKDKLVAVTWDDPRIDQADVYTREEIARREAQVFTTLGLLVRDDEKFVGVANEVCIDGTFRGVTTIPRVLVTGIEVLGSWPKAQRRKRASQSGVLAEGASVQGGAGEPRPQ